MKAKLDQLKGKIYLLISKFQKKLKGKRIHCFDSKGKPYYLKKTPIYTMGCTDPVSFVRSITDEVPNKSQGE